MSLQAAQDFANSSIEFLPDLMRFVFKGIMLSEGPSRILRAAKTLYGEAVKHLNSARAKKDLDEFYNELFLAIPGLVGAESGFGFWGYSKPRTRKTDSALRASENAGRLLEMVLTSLMIDFENTYMSGRVFRSHKAHAEEVARTRGRKAAHAVIDDHIERLLYPRSLRSTFLADIDR